MGITINGSSAAGNIDLGTNGTITDLAVGGLPDGTVDADTLASGSVPLSFRNKIINGAMEVNQRGTRTAGTSNGYYACDRWRTRLWDIGTYTIQQDTDGPEGFRYSLKWDCTTADTSVAAGSYIGVRYIFEGDDLQDLKYGTSNAESMTLSFWIKSTVTGTAAVRFKNLNSGGNRMIGQNVTISAANTWEKKTVTIAGDTATAIEGGNGAEYEIFIWFNAGTNYTSGAVPTSWETSTDADLAAGANIAINNSTSNNIWLTGVQWEKGTTATEFEYRTYGNELLRCQRYYENSYPPGYYPGHNFNEEYSFGTSKPVCLNFVASDDTTTAISYPFTITKRAASTVTIYNANGGGTGTAHTYKGTGTTNGAVALNVIQVNPHHALLGTSLGAVNQASEMYFHYVADAEL